MYILAFHGSPRKGGNSEILLKAFLKPFEKEGSFFIEKIILYDLNFSPCLECGECEKEGKCKLKDDFTPFYEKLLKADLLVLSVPIFFYSHPAMVQAFFERLQPFWIRKNVFKEKLRKSTLKAILLCVGATKGEKLFEGIRRSFKYALYALEGELIAEFFVRGVEKKGEILEKGEVLREVERLGAKVLKELKGS